MPNQARKRIRIMKKIKPKFGQIIKWIEPELKDFPPAYYIYLGNRLQKTTRTDDLYTVTMDDQIYIQGCGYCPIDYLLVLDIFSGSNIKIAKPKTGGAV